MRILSTILCAALFAVSLSADIRVEPKKPVVKVDGAGPTTQQVEGVTIEMRSEVVELTLGDNGKEPYLDVKVTFYLYNHSEESESHEIAFPVGGVKNFSSFKASTDGVTHETTLKDLGSKAPS